MNWNRGKPQGPYYTGSPGSSGPPAGNTSIFGLISTVNKGILKNPTNQSQSHTRRGQSSPTAVESIQSPHNFSNSPHAEVKDSGKEAEFLQAKSKIEQIQKGLWKSGSKSSKPELAADPFKVPVLPVRAPSSARQSHKTKLGLVEYDDDEEEHTDRSSSFSKQKALEEIDRYRAAPKYASKLFASAEKDSVSRESKDRSDHYQQSYSANTESYSEYDEEMSRKKEDSYFDAYNVTARDLRETDRDYPSRMSNIKKSQDLDKDNKSSSSYEVFDYGHSSDYSLNVDSKRQDDRQIKQRRFEETKPTDVSNKDKHGEGSYQYRISETDRRYDDAKSSDRDFLEPKASSYRDDRGRDNQSKRVFRESKTKESNQNQWRNRSNPSINPIKDQGKEKGFNLNKESSERSPNYPGYERNTSKHEPVYKIPDKSVHASSEQFDYYGRKNDQLDQVNMNKGKRREEDETFKEQYNWGYNDNRRQHESEFTTQQRDQARGNRRDSESSKGSGEMLYEDYLFKDNKKDNQSDRNRQLNPEQNAQIAPDKQNQSFRGLEKPRVGGSQNIRDFDKQCQSNLQSSRDTNIQRQSFRDPEKPRESRSQNLSDYNKRIQQGSQNLREWDKQKQGGSQSFRDFNDPGHTYVDDRNRYDNSDRIRLNESPRDYDQMEQDRYGLTYEGYGSDQLYPKDYLEFEEVQQWQEDKRTLPIIQPNWSGTQEMGGAIPVQTIIADPGLVPQTMAVPAFFCKDCNLTFFDQDVYETHLKSDSHLLVLQKKAQELFQLREGGRKSRFDVVEQFPMTQVQLPLTPVTMVTGVPPPTPKGPLQAENVGWDSLTISWGRLTGNEANLVEKYVVEYRNARETRWATVGYTNKFDFNVDGLQENTDYLFRVFSMNGMEKSEVLESVLITTRRRKDPPSRRNTRSSPERIRPDRDRSNRGRNRSAERDRKSGPDRDRDRRSSLERGKDKRSSLERDRDRSRKSSREKDKDDRSRKRGSSDDRRTNDKKDNKSDKNDKKPETDSKKKNDSKERKDKDGKSSKDSARGKEERDKKDREKKVDEGKAKSDDEKKAEEIDEVVEDVECIFYREIGNIEEQPLLGLEYLWEIVSYKPTTPVRYLCKLCNTKCNVSYTMMHHICGLPHKMAYLKKHDPVVYDTVSMIPLRKDQIERVNYEAQLIEDKKGRGCVRVMIMLNPQDTDGKTTYKDPVEVKAPPPNRAKITDPAPTAAMLKSKFWTLLEEAIDVHGCEDTAVIGLSYLKEYIHPFDEEPPRYMCKLCSIVCTEKTVVFHVLGRKHRGAYLKAHCSDFWEIASKSRDVKRMIAEKVKEIHAKEGPGDVKSIIPKNNRLWRHSFKKDKGYGGEGDGHEDTGQGVDVPMTTNEGKLAEEAMETQGEGKDYDEKEGIKFGIKKADQSNTNVKSTNVLEQDKPKTKEPFDWNKENAALQAKIQNQTIIKSNRKAKFITVYSEFFKRYPVIGLQWVTEFQKPDPKLEPWYMCFMCQQKLQWKNVLDHVTSSSHRIGYMKKNYEEKYKDLRSIIHANKSKGRAIVESHSRDIVAKEGPVTSMEVMLELSINKEALKSVMKVKDNVKSSSTVTKTSEDTQDNIASLSSASQQSTSVLIPGTVSTPLTTMSTTSIPGLITPTSSTLSQQQIPSLLQLQVPIPLSHTQLQMPDQSGQVPVQAANIAYTGYTPAANNMPGQSQYQQGMYSQANVPQIPQSIVQQSGFMPNQMPTGYSTNVTPTTGYQTQLGIQQAVSTQQQLSTPAVNTSLNMSQSTVPAWQTAAQASSQLIQPATQAYPAVSHQGQLQPAGLLPDPMQHSVASGQVINQGQAHQTGSMQPNSSISIQAQTVSQTTPAGIQQGTAGNSIQNVIEKQAEKVLTQKILQTGQFPLPGTSVSISNTDQNRNMSQSYDRQRNNQGSWMNDESVNRGDLNRDELDRGEKRPYGQRENDRAYDNTKRYRREGNDRFGQNSGRNRESRFDDASSHAQRSGSPYDQRSSRGYRDNSNSYTSDERSFGNNEQRDSYDRRDYRDNNDRWPRTNIDGSYKSYSNESRNIDNYEDSFEGEDNDYDLPLSPKELENLVQMYCDRPEDENEDFDEFQDDYSQSDSRSQTGSTRYDDYADSRHRENFRGDSRERDGYGSYNRGSSRERGNSRSRSRFDSPEQMDSGEGRDRDIQYGGYDRQGGRQQFEEDVHADSHRNSPTQSQLLRERDKEYRHRQRDRRNERDRSPINEVSGSERSSRSVESSRLEMDKFGSRSRPERRSRWSDREGKGDNSPSSGMSDRRFKAQGQDEPNVSRPNNQSNEFGRRRSRFDSPEEDDSYPDPSMEEIEKLLRRGTSRLPDRDGRGNRDDFTRNVKQQGPGSRDSSFGQDNFGSRGAGASRGQGERDEWKPYGGRGGGQYRGVGPNMRGGNSNVNTRGRYNENDNIDNEDSNLEDINRQGDSDFRRQSDDRQYTDRMHNRGGFNIDEGLNEGNNQGQNWHGRNSRGRGNIMGGRGGMNRGR